MDINEQLAKIVEGLIADITANVTSQIDSVINNAIQHRIANYDFTKQITEAATLAFDKKVNEYTIDSKKLENKIVNKINDTITLAQNKTTELVDQTIQARLSTSDFQKSITDSLVIILNDRITNLNFPPNSINGSSINLSNLEISGDNISGGIIKNFSSVGIDDRATQVALTILDDITVVENNLLTKDLTVQGSMTINGNFTVNGVVPEDSEFFRNIISGTTKSTLDSLNDTIFNNYNNVIFAKIKQDGLDLNKITIDGKEILKTDSLGQSVVKSNLQHLGELKELQVQGESFLGSTLYVNQKRVGINTIEPSAALTVWDDEIEIIAKKKSNNVGLFGTSRNQKIILSSNNKDNIVLNDDGSVQIDHLKVGVMQFTTSSTPPNYVSERCHVVWNSNPNPGGPLGWICLGGANWANFGIID